MKVYKYSLREDYKQLPKGFKILHVGQQHGEFYVWALVDPSQPMVAALRIVGTGHDIDQGDTKGKFWGTHLFYAGDIVLHVWELDQTLT